MRSVRNIPDVIQHKHLGSVEVAGSIHNAVVVCVGDVRAVRGPVIEALGPGVRGAKENALAQSALQVDLHCVVKRTTDILRFDNGREPFIRSKGVGIGAFRICLHGSRQKLVHICQLLQVVAAAPNVAEREGCEARKLVLKRQVPSPRLRTGVGIAVGGEGERQRVLPEATRVVDTAAGYCGRRLERSVAADVNGVADAKPLHVAPALRHARQCQLPICHAKPTRGWISL